MKKEITKRSIIEKIYNLFGYYLIEVKNKSKYSNIIRLRKNWVEHGWLIRKDWYIIRAGYRNKKKMAFKCKENIKFIKLTELDMKRLDLNKFIYIKIK